MLLTLATRSFAKTIRGTGKDPLTLLDLPAFTIRELQLRGLNVDAGMLAGWSFEDLDRLRDHADKAACPCLVLVERPPLPLASHDDATREQALKRMDTLSRAANRLGCSSIAISIEAKDTDDDFERAAEQIKSLMPLMDRMELTLLLAPAKGLTQEPDRLIELIKQIGGFRIGALPSFAHAAETSDLRETLRKIAPYAGAIHASINTFTKTGKHSGYDLQECTEALQSVGFLNTLAIEFVGRGDPVKPLEQAREVLQQLIETETA